MAKIKHLTVRQQLAPPAQQDYDSRKPVHHYVVEQVKNSSSPILHEPISVSDLERYCESEEWEVVIK